MPRTNRRKRAFFFLAAVVLPSGVLVGTTVRLIRQERELAVRRTEENRALLALRIGQALLEDLRDLEDRVAAEPLGPREMSALMDFRPALVTLAVAQEGRLVFPWEVVPDPSTTLDRTRVDQYVRLLEQGEAAEYREGNPVRAQELYGRAAAVFGAEDREGEASAGQADGPSGAASLLLGDARLRQAGALLRAGRTTEARAAFLQLAESPPFIADREGMPFCVYGLDGLLQAGADPQDLIPLLREMLGGSVRFSLPALLALRDVARAVADDEEGGTKQEELQALDDAIARQEATLEELEGLRTDFPGLLVTAGRRTGPAEDDEGPRWFAYGNEPWLVGVVGDGAGGPARIAVVRPALLLGSREDVEEGGARDPALRADEDEVASAARRVTLLAAGAIVGESLGRALNGLRASFPEGYPPPPERGGVEGWFFRLLLPVILLLSGFTAYLAWRDVRREAEAVRLRSQFVSSVTHELKTPLTSIRMFAETVRLGRHSGPEAQRRYLDTVIHETERLSRLINNVLDFARIDRGEKTYHMAPADVGAAAREAARELAHPLAQGGYTLTVDIGEDLSLVEADTDALTQALLNLLSNAVKFSEEGSRIDLRVFRNEDDVLLQVEDEGRGIALQDQEAIFHDFYRTADAEERGIPGTGLGLALVAHVAEAHGGRVEVDSELGRGSTFTIRIPVDRRSAPTAGRRDAAPADPTSDHELGAVP